MKSMTVLVSLLAALGLIAGCATPSGSHPVAAHGSAEAATASGAGSAVRPLNVTSAPEQLNSDSVPQQLNFTAQTVNGGQFSGASLAGKPAALWFWAPWCPICQREAPGVAAAAAGNPGVTFVGVAALAQAPAMREFVADYNIGSFTNIADVDGAVWQRFGVTSQPAYAFVSSNGDVQVVRGSLSAGALADRVAALS